MRAFLALFLVCAVSGVEQLWPFTGFRLFSRSRHDTATIWVADTVGLGGERSRLWFTSLPRAYQDLYLLMQGFRRLPAERQQAICEAWLSGARELRPATEVLRIYRVNWHALPRNGDRPAGPLARTLEYACS